MMTYDMRFKFSDFAQLVDLNPTALFPNSARQLSL
jgi:hypothetical protein